MIMTFFFYFFAVLPIIMAVLGTIVVLKDKAEARSLDSQPEDRERARLQAQAMEELDEINRLTGVLPPKPKEWDLRHKEQPATYKSAKQIAMEASRKKLPKHAEMTPSKLYMELNRQHAEELWKLKEESDLAWPEVSYSYPHYPRYEQTGASGHPPMREVDPWGGGVAQRVYTAEDIKNMTIEEYAKNRHALVAAGRMDTVPCRPRAFTPRTVGPSV